MAINLLTTLRQESVQYGIKKYPYFWFSILFHVVIIYVLSNIVLKPIVDTRIHQKIKVSLNNTYRMSMQENVKDMANTQQQLMETLSEDTKKNIPLEPIEEKTISNEKVTANELLELARKISENIRKIERELRAQDLERAVTMSHNEALKTVMSLELAIPEYRANRMPGEEKVRSVEHMEEVAKNSLRQRESVMDKRGLGDPMSRKTEKNDMVDPITQESDGAIVKGATNSNNKLAPQNLIHSKNDFVDLWLDHIPPVNRESPQKIAGRIIKDGAPHADRIFINSWYIAGPFPISDKKYPPEYAIDLDAIYYGKENKIVGWQYVSNSRYPLTPPPSDKAGIFFGYTEVILDHAQDLWVWVGADDFVSLQLNDKVIWNSTVFNKKFNTIAYEKNNPEKNNWNLTEYKRLVHFNAGRNTFKFKLTNSDSTSFFSLVLTK
ncbi:MAG: hypothetical protein EOO53_14885 [Gammaproteobacteria bacterium]|nr:MAG: hypothetical protein EOO53_14885 [Gammaproteobacteria bacterium]